MLLRAERRQHPVQLLVRLLEPGFDAPQPLREVPDVVGIGQWPPRGDDDPST